MQEWPIDVRHTPWEKAPRALPEGVALVGIGDLHGRADLLERLLGALEGLLAAVPSKTCVFVGDYGDRGPWNLKAIDVARAGLPGATNLHLRGNHEDILLEALRTN